MGPHERTLSGDLRKRITSEKDKGTRGLANHCHCDELVLKRKVPQVWQKLWKSKLD